MSIDHLVRVMVFKYKLELYQSFEKATKNDRQKFVCASQR